MGLLTKYQLNNNYSLEVCLRFDEGSLNGEKFICEDKWVLKIDKDEHFSTKTTYATEASKKFNIYTECYNSKEAIQKILIYAYTGKEKKLRDMWFRIITN